MGYIVDKIGDIILDSIVELGKEKCEELFAGAKLKGILKKSINDYIDLQKINNPRANVDCIIDKESFEQLDENLIQPNFTIEELERNLNSFFEKCIITDNMEKAYTIRRYICHSYKLSVAGLISIGQVDEDVHNVNKNVKESTNKICGKIDETENKIIRTLKNMPQQQLCFLEELEDSRVYCYISMTLKREIDEDFLFEIADNINAEEETYIDEQGFFNVSFDFLEPITQYTLREYLKYINEQFWQNNIGILSIRSHF